MTRKFKLDWKAGKHHRFALTEEDRRRLQAEINGVGGANDQLRWMQRHAENLDLPGQAVGVITDGLLERIPPLAEWEDGDGGFQRMVPLQSLIRAGLVEGHIEPDQPLLL